MADSYPHMPAGEVPLQSWMYQPMNRRLPNMQSLPELHVIVGRDSHSAGVTIYSWEPTGGTRAHYNVVFAARWATPVSSTGEALRIAHSALAAALAELVPEPTD